MNMIFRLLWIYLRAQWRPRFGILEPYEVRLRVLPLDLDVCLHMNNGRYLSMMDLGRVDMLLRSGLWDAMRKAGFTATVAAETIRFRKSLLPFQWFTLETRLLGWDDKALFMQQRFLRRRRKDNAIEVAAEGIVRMRLIPLNGAKTSTAFIRELGPLYLESPRLPGWVNDWNKTQSEAGGRSADEKSPIRAPATGISTPSDSSRSGLAGL
jgi:acyl-CoA thioesterase FadM